MENVSDEKNGTQSFAALEKGTIVLYSDTPEGESSVNPVMITEGLLIAKLNIALQLVAITTQPGLALPTMGSGEKIKDLHTKALAYLYRHMK